MQLILHRNNRFLSSEDFPFNPTTRSVDLNHIVVALCIGDWADLAKAVEDDLFPLADELPGGICQAVCNIVIPPTFDRFYIRTDCGLQYLAYPTGDELLCWAKRFFSGAAADRGLHEERFSFFRNCFRRKMGILEEP